MDFDSEGFLYILDSLNGNIVSVDTISAKLSVFAGTAGILMDVPSSATDLCIGPDDSLYVSTGDNVVRVSQNGSIHYFGSGIRGFEDGKINQRVKFNGTRGYCCLIQKGASLTIIITC